MTFSPCIPWKAHTPWVLSGKRPEPQFANPCSWKSVAGVSPLRILGRVPDSVARWQCSFTKKMVVKSLQVLFWNRKENTASSLAALHPDSLVSVHKEAPSSTVRNCPAGPVKQQFLPAGRRTSQKGQSSVSSTWLLPLTVKVLYAGTRVCPRP